MKYNLQLILILISILFIFLLLNTPMIENFQNDNGYDIIIIAGQSNSVGRGIEEHTFPKKNGINFKTLKETINMYKDDYHGKNGKSNNLICSFTKDNTIRVSAVDPIEHQEDYPNIYFGKRLDTSFGFAVSFAREYIRQNKLAKGRKILLVGCGYGRTGFSNGKWMAPNGSLYKGTIKRVKEAFKNNDIGTANRFIALLWHQGEADVEKPQGYIDNVSKCLNGIRNEIQKKDPESIPVLMGGLVQDYEKFTDKYIEPVKKVKENINFKFVPSEPMKDVTYNKFKLFNHYLLSDKETGEDHFSKSSQIEFGKRYFYIFNNNKFDVEN